MEKNTVTPGPWVVAIQSDDYHCIETATCAICNDVRYEADAKLIAAAPDLAVALSDVEELWMGDNVPVELTAKVRAALAKAGL